MSVAIGYSRTVEACSAADAHCECWEPFGGCCACGAEKPDDQTIGGVERHG